MAAQGYIGRAPGESSVIVARQTFTPTGITTNFTFASGYEIGYVDAYLNGARLIEGSDYTATDGSVVGLTTHAINGDVLELVAYKAFNLANVTGANGDFVIPDKIVHKEDTDTAIRFPQVDTFTVETAGSEVIRIDANGNVGIGTTNTLKIADPKNQSGLNVGFITANSITAAAGSFGTLNVSGTLTFEDVSNQNVVGFATFQKGIIVQGAGSTTTTLNVTGVSTMTGDANFGAALNIPDAITHVGDTNTKIRFPANDTFTVETSGSERLRVDSLGEVRVGSAFSVSQAGVVTATSFFGSGAGLTGVASTDNINTSTLAQFTGGVGIADSIFHIGDDNTAIRFPAADTFTVETGGSERIRVDSSGNFGLGTNNPSTKFHLAGSGTQTLRIEETGSTVIGKLFATTSKIGISAQSNHPLSLEVNNDEKARIDTSGRILVGTDTAPTAAVTSSALFVVEGYTGVPTGDALISLQRGQAPASISSGAQLGGINFGANDGSRYAQIHVNSDGVGGTNDYPGRLVFSTTSDGSATPTERLRIDSSGRLIIGSTQNVNGDQLQVNNTGGSNLGVSRFSDNAGGPDLFLVKSRNGTPGSHTAVADNDVLGQIRFKGDDGTNYVEGCRLFAEVNGSVSTNTVTTDLVFGSGTTGTERIRIGASGQIGIAGANFGTSGQVLTSKGSGSSVAWEDASSGGITTTAYSPAANAIIQIGLGTAQHHELTLSAGFTTVTTTGGAFGESHSLVLIQPSSGICTVGFSTFFKFPSGSTPSMSEGGSKVDLISFVVKNIARNVGTGATELLASAGLNYN